MSGYDEIAACAMAYAKAQEQHRHDDLDSAEAIIAARLALAHCLIEAGWQPGPEQSEALTRDRAVLGLVPGSMERWSALPP